MGTAEPAFRAQLQRLEQAAGLPGADIRLMMEVINDTRSKIQQLGLDPHDTTGPELYQALKQRLTEDEARLRDKLGVAGNTDVQALLEAVKRQLDTLDVATHTFVVKQAVMRAMLKKLQPKVTMKRLGYRSMDSMIKHEPTAALLAACSILESHEWQQKRLEAYRKLKSSSFEVRKASFLVPATKHWPEIAADYVSLHKHNQLVAPELGAVILLPLEQDLPGLCITSMLLALESVNDMRSLGSFLKLQQVRPDFGDMFARSVQHEPLTAAEIAGQALPWKLVQWFYGHGHSEYYPEAFEPHVQPEDLSWHDGEVVLAGIHPVLEFWQDSQLLALLDAGQPVSLNMLDVALSVCNGLSYSERLVHNMRTSLSRELMARYLHHDNLQALLTGKLDEQLAPALAFEME